VPNPFLSHLECGHCAARHDVQLVQTVCGQCGGPLLVRYQLTEPGLPSQTDVLQRPPGQFRFHEVLPNDTGINTPTLGEGATPLLEAHRLGPGVWIKDEAQNPTGSFKARGMANAMARAVELGLDRFTIPSNGNAGGAAAAYGALHGVVVEVLIPRATPTGLIAEPRAYGARVELVDGTISDAGRLVAHRAQSNGAFNLATLREPYRIEGKKMMGYELFWDLGRLPDVILYPTGGGTGLIGMVKAFDEMEQLGWIGTERPRMVAVQTDSCAPIVKAFHEGANAAAHWDGAGETAAYGLRVPSALGDRLMLEGLRRTRGTAVAVTEGEMLDATKRMAIAAGVWGTPEGGAGLAAAERLTRTGWIESGETIVIFNTAAAAKYL
jgi:threonine synthase